MGPTSGAAYQVAPSAIWELGAEIITLGVEPNGTNINDGVGSTAIEALQAKVVAEGADIGIALDGDADRLIVVDEKGRAVDGDQIMALIATRMHEKGALTGGGVVATRPVTLGARVGPRSVARSSRSELRGRVVPGGGVEPPLP